MVDIQSPTAEIRRGKKKMEIKGQKYNGLRYSRATINSSNYRFGGILYA